MGEKTECTNCGYGLQSEWAVCPKCGMRLSGRASQEALTQILTKVITGLVEAGLLQAESNAKKNGKDAQAQQLAVARQLAKDLGPMVAETLVEHGYRWAAKAKANRDARGGSRLKLSARGILGQGNKPRGIGALRARRAGAGDDDDSDEDEE
jgi:hypothetical protein